MGRKKKRATPARRGGPADRERPSARAGTDHADTDRAGTDRAGTDRTARPSLLLACALSAFGGTVMFLAFPGFDVWPLAFVATAPIFAAVDLRHPRSLARLTPKGAILAGLVGGTVGNLGGYYWIIGMLERFSGFPYVLCLLFGVLLCAAQGGQFALFAWLYHRLRGREVSVMVAAPIAWGAAELAYPMLFPWYYANHFYQQPALLQIADLGGALLVAFVAMTVNAAVWELVRVRLARERVRWRGPLVALGLLGATLAYGVGRIATVEADMAEAPHLEVGMVQVDMGIFEKREDPWEGRRRHIDMSLALEREVDLDLLVWPESAMTFFLPEDVTNVRGHVTGDVSTPLVFGGLARRTVDGVERHYNTAYMVDERGEILGTYDKTYLLAFGEYLPLGDLLPVLYEWSPNSGQFTPGDHVRPLAWGGYRLTTLICYEDILPRFVRRAVREGDPHVIVNVTNDSWFGDTSEPWQHLALATLRSVEHHRWLVRSTNSGVSAFVDPVGRITELAGVGERRSIHEEIQMLEGTTLYALLGDWPGWACVGAVVWLAFLRRRRGASAPAAS